MKASEEPYRHDVRINYHGPRPGLRPECRTCDWVGPVSSDGILARSDALEHSRLEVEPELVSDIGGSIAHV